MRFLTLFSLAAALYVFWRAVCPLRCHWIWKALLAALLIFTGLFFKIMRTLGGDLPFGPDVPGWFQLGYSWLYMSCIAYFLCLAAAQALRIFVLGFIPAWRSLTADAKRSLSNYTHLFLLIAVCTVVTLGETNAMRLPGIHEIELKLKSEAPAVERPLRIALLADLHADAVKKRDFIQAIVERTNAQEPDIILIAGDFVDGRVARRGEQLEPLRELKAPVYAVPGNHEYYSGYSQWKPFLESLGIHMLNNSHVHLAEHGIVLAGVTDSAAGYFGQEEPDICAALQGAPAGEPVILLAHQPNLARLAESLGVALQLSGHTHGGLMPGLAQITALYNSGFVRGLYDVSDTMQLYVSPGTSLWSGSPLRLCNPSEITLITITPSTPAPDSSK